MTFDPGGRIDPGRARRSGGSGGRGRPVAIGGGVGGLVVVLLAVFLGVDPSTLTGGGVGGTTTGGDVVAAQGADGRCATGQEANTSVDCRVIATAESLDAVWGAVLPRYGREYAQPGLDLFTGSVQTGCGAATSAVGPFYCPADRYVYIDVSFFDVLEQRFGSSGGPLAQEYVVAHEFGHHISNELGYLAGVQSDPRGEESAAVRSELQADCYAGLWAHHATRTPDPDTGRPLLQPLTQADVADALSAAAAVGDDRIQAATGGRVDPEAWTHGSAEQRQRWFTTGYDAGTLEACDTFAAADV